MYASKSRGGRAETSSAVTAPSEVGRTTLASAKTIAAPLIARPSVINVAVAALAGRHGSGKVVSTTLPGRRTRMGLWCEHDCGRRPPCPDSRGTASLEVRADAAPMAH
jgi:hypothetical protein